MAATTWRVNNSTSLGGEVCAPWTTGHAYALGARVVCRVAYATTAARAFVYECTDAGTSHATTEPVWPTVVGNTVVEDTADDTTWTCRSPGDGSWDNASCYLLYVLNYTTIAAGDSVYIDDGHSEALSWGSSLVGLQLLGSTSFNIPIMVICVDKADDSFSTGAIVSQLNTSYELHFQGFAYCYGVTFKSACFIGTGRASTTNCYWILEECLFDIDGSADYIRIGFDGTGRSATLVLINSDIDFANANNYISQVTDGLLIWKGGSMIAANGVTALFNNADNGVQHAIIQNVDLSGVGNGANARSLMNAAEVEIKNMLFERCKLPTDAGFTVTSGAWAQSGNGKIRLHHCSSGNRYYDFHEESYEGTVTDETTIVRTGGASDGTTAQAWKMISSANTVDNINGLESPPITIWNSATTEKTFTIECIWDSAANIEDDEIWMELEYPVDNTSGLGAVAKDKCAMLGSPADQTTSAETWTTTDLTNPNEFKLSVTVTPGKAGPVTARVYLAKASTTVYVDPLITIS